MFDFDGTLTSRDSLGEFIRYARGTCGFLSAVLKSLPKIAAWKLGRISNSEAKQALFSRAFGGMSLSRFDELGRGFAEKVDGMLRPDVLAEMRRAADRGETVVVLLASVGNWIRPWAARNDVDRVIATEAEVGKSGLITGRFATPNCYGAEKVCRLEEAYPELKERRASFHVSAWSDSGSDSPLFDYADEAHRV